MKQPRKRVPPHLPSTSSPTLPLCIGKEEHPDGHFEVVAISQAGPVSFSTHPLQYLSPSHFVLQLFLSSTVSHEHARCFLLPEMQHP